MTESDSTGSSQSLERVEGEYFAVEPLTPYLKVHAERVYQRLREALVALPAVSVERGITLRVREGAILMPEVAVLPSGETGAPHVVVELRRESTERYALGIKRLAYASAGAKQFWFIDPRAGTLRVLTLDPTSRQYNWPGDVLGEDDVVLLSGLPRIDVPVRDLI